MSSIQEFTIKRHDDTEISLSVYAKKVLLFVNVASTCGFTDGHYKELQELYDQYKERGLEILAFPCDQFKQAKGDSCRLDLEKYKITFEMFAKIDVNGRNAHPLFEYLKSKQRGILGTTSIKWNFTKFLVDRKGNVVQRAAGTTMPSAMKSEIEKCLEQSDE